MSNSDKYSKKPGFYFNYESISNLLGYIYDCQKADNISITDNSNPFLTTLIKSLMEENKQDKATIITFALDILEDSEYAYEIPTPFSLGIVNNLYTIVINGQRIHNLTKEQAECLIEKDLLSSVDKKTNHIYKQYIDYFGNALFNKVIEVSKEITFNKTKLDILNDGGNTFLTEELVSE